MWVPLVSGNFASKIPKLAHFWPRASVFRWMNRFPRGSTGQQRPNQPPTGLTLQLSQVASPCWALSSKKSLGWELTSAQGQSRSPRAWPEQQCWSCSTAEASETRKNQRCFKSLGLKSHEVSVMWRYDKMWEDMWSMWLVLGRVQCSEHPRKTVVSFGLLKSALCNPNAEAFQMLPAKCPLNVLPRNSRSGTDLSDVF